MIDYAQGFFLSVVLHLNISIKSYRGFKETMKRRLKKLIIMGMYIIYDV